LAHFRVAMIPPRVSTLTQLVNTHVEAAFQERSRGVEHAKTKILRPHTAGSHPPSPGLNDEPNVPVSNRRGGPERVDSARGLPSIDSGRAPRLRGLFQPMELEHALCRWRTRGPDAPCA
jgi:hypothetical protein